MESKRNEDGSTKEEGNIYLQTLTSIMSQAVPKIQMFKVLIHKRILVHKNQISTTQKYNDSHVTNEDDSEEEKDLPQTKSAEVNRAWQEKLNEIGIQKTARKEKK